MFYLDRHKKQDIIIVLLKAKQDRGQNAQKLIHNFHEKISTGEFVPRSGQVPLSQNTLLFFHFKTNSLIFAVIILHF